MLPGSCYSVENALQPGSVNFCKCLSTIYFNAHPKLVDVCPLSGQRDLHYCLRLSASWGRRPVTEMLSHLLQSKAGPARLVSVLVLLLLPSFFTACSGSNSSPSHARANTPQAVQVTVAPALR